MYQLSQPLPKMLLLRLTEIHYPVVEVLMVLVEAALIFVFGT